jgi:hypothetical protein
VLSGIDAPSQTLVERRIAMHLAVDLKLRRDRANDRGRLAHLAGAEAESREPKLECDTSAAFGCDAEAAISCAAMIVISAISSAHGSTRHRCR